MSSKTPQQPSSGGDSALRVLIADRSCHYRDTLRRVLSHYPNCTVTGEASELREAARLATASDPHIVLLDVDLIMNESSSRLRRLADAFPHLDVIIMLNEESADYRLAVAERWGYSCIVKDQAERELDQIVATAGSAVA